MEKQILGTGVPAGDSPVAERKGSDFDPPPPPVTTILDIPHSTAPPTSPEAGRPTPGGAERI